MGDAKLKVIAAELITQVKKSVTINWTLRESARAKIKVMVKRILNKHGHPRMPCSRNGEGRTGLSGNTGLPASSSGVCCQRLMGSFVGQRLEPCDHDINEKTDG